MEFYDLQLEKAASSFRTLPRKLSEENVRALGSIYHFETFEEDEITMSKPVKRVSLSGSIVVIDLDFNQDNQVEKASVSLSNETATNSIYSPMSPINDPSGHIYKALNEPRLDGFEKMLAFLRRCDRFSTKNVDCFRSLDLISESIHWYVEKSKSQEFGQLVINPPKWLGLGFLYDKLYDGPKYAYLDIISGSRQKYCLRNFTQIDEWLDKEGLQWREIPPSSDTEARAELVITLEPPVIISAYLAEELDAVVSNSSPTLNDRKASSSYSVRKHPRFASNESPSDDFDVLVGNMLPFPLVEISQVPVKCIAQIPSLLAYLKQYSLITALVNSVLQGPETVWTNEAADLNIADALELNGQPVHRKRIPISVALRFIDEDLVLDASWVISDLRMEIILRKGIANPEVRILPDTFSNINVADLSRLVARGNLALAISYAISNAGKLRRRSTSNTTRG